MLNEIGELLGTTIVILYVLTILNYVVKFINKNYRSIIKKNEMIFKWFNIFMKIIVKNHRLFGLLTIAVLLSHFLIQFNLYGISITGGIAASIMILQVAMGIYGFKTKKRGGTWLLVHRSVSVMLLVAILFHI